MAELQDIFDSGELTELTLQTTRVRDEILGLRTQNVNQESEIQTLISDLNVLTGRVNAIDVALLNLQIEQNERTPEIVNTGSNIGLVLSEVECQAWIPNPSTKRYTIIQGTGPNQRFIVFWDGANYIYERLDVAT